MLLIFQKIRFLGLVAGMCFLSSQTNAMGYRSNYASCINYAGTLSANVASCMSEELRYQNSRVENNFKASLALYNRTEKKQQKNTQKQWKKLRASNCRKDTSSDSQARQTRYLNCALKMTVTRADGLEKSLYRLK